MKKHYLSLLALWLAVSTAMMGAKKVHTLGDSTMAPYNESTETKRGWGMYFGNFLTNGWTSVNYAKGGRDSRGGYNELWQNAKNNVTEGDYVIIQFAHNDEKYNGMDNLELQAYYTQIGDAANAAAVKSDGRGTVPSTTYKACLKQIIDAVKAKGATPILVSAVSRCYFNNEKVTRAGRHDLGDKFSVLTETGIKENQKVAATDHTMDYSYHIKQLAEAENVTFIDMTTATANLYESYGSAKAKSTLFCEGDNTHYNTTGALLAARLCAQLMKEKGILADVINVPTDLSISPATADMGEGYLGQTAVKELTLNGFGLSPTEGTITIAATDGIELSIDKKAWSSVLSINYVNGTLVQNFYARVLLSQVGNFSGTVTASLGDKLVEVPLSINVIELGGGAPFNVVWPLQQNDEATVEGTATAGAVKLVGLAKYNNVSGKGIMVCPGETAEAGKAGSWVAAEDDSPYQYVQLSVCAPEGQKLDINQIQMKVGAHGGNGMRCHVYYSIDGFVNRTAIYAPTSMSSGVMNEIDEMPVIKLDEGEELQIRVYPWYNQNATGKWLCVSDVLVSGQTKDAAGVNITGSIIYKLDKGGLDQGDDAEMTPAEMAAGFIAKKWTAGSALTTVGTITYQGKGTSTVQTKIYNGSGSSFASAPTADNTLTLMLTPEDGFRFVPAKVNFEGARYGTDSGKLTVTIEAGDNKQTLVENGDVNRSGNNLAIKQFSYEMNNLVASAIAPLKLNFSFIGLGNTKTMGLSNVVIEGQLAGAAVQTTKYVLNAVADPAEAGTISREPDYTSYKEGTQVTLVAKKNFGYKFKEWQDATGSVLGNKAELTLTMDEEKKVKAVFEKVEVFSVSTKVTNDAERSLGSVTLIPNDHAGRYEAGTEIVAVANESKILKFTNWTDEYENAGTQASRTLTVDSNMELVANFEVQDFIAVFDASVNNYYAYPTTAGYPFPADITWDDNRQASSAVVKVSDGSLVFTKDGGTPVVRNRESVVLPNINGLYQNGYATTDVAFQFQFSTVGFTNATFVADMAAKNMASKNWKALVSTDGTTFAPIENAVWQMTPNTLKPLSIELPALAIGQEMVFVRIMGNGSEMLSSSYRFDQEFNGLNFTSHSESGVGNVFVLGEVDGLETSIKDVRQSVSVPNADFYTIDGCKAGVNAHGVLIERCSNGRVRKVVRR